MPAEYEVLYDHGEDGFRSAVTFANDPPLEAGQFANFQSRAIRSSGSHRARIGAEGMTPTQGALVIFMDPDNANGDAAQDSNGVVVEWALDGSNNIVVDYDKGIASFRVRREGGGSFSVQAVSATFAAADPIALYVAWDASNVYAAFNGGTIETAANTHIPSSLPALLDVGSGNTVAFWNGRYFEAAYGAVALFDAPLTQAQWEAFAALRNDRPPLFGEHVGQAMTALWVGEEDNYYDDALDQLTADVRAGGIEVTRGTDPRAALFTPIAGTGDIELDNTENAYGPASAIGPDDHLRIRAAFNAATRTLFRGPVDIVEQQPALARQAATVSANGVFAELAGTPASTLLYENITIGTAIGHVLDAAGFPAGLRDLDAGRASLRWWWLDEEDAFDALLTLLNTEGPTALLYEQGDGTIVFRQRYALRELSTSDSVQSTYRDDGAEPLYANLQYDAHSREVVDAARIPQRTRSAKANETIWSLGESVTLGPNETRTFTARRNSGDPFQSATVAHTLASGSLSAGPSLNRTSGANVTISVTAGANGAEISSLSVDADPVTVDSESTFEAGSGRRAWRGSTRAEISAVQAQGIAELIVLWASGGRPIVTLELDDDAADAVMDASLDRDIGHRVRVVHDALSYDAEAWVRHKHHRVLQGPVQRSTLTLEDTTGAPVFWKLGTSSLDGVDVLGR